MKLIEKLKYKLGIWLICDKKFSRTASLIMVAQGKMRCIHCGKNPFFRE